ncbi:hypothetical protein Thena_1732 [Thermodesulfobium narugense DSM 14796]|uniref:CRISPR system Cms protein Csm2 n=1 Tax=Thermodesulfobium narugense DSM 14796 TaxID=747365 RepID=M1E9I5_9BACT|nr:type III-A CRISPR-associated protein Csm2 [Thermodesulfobium narugense]AEE15339.1 hypothetical protein Thena_1732 [Thermodesulfobium narugense DSM 14796]
MFNVPKKRNLTNSSGSYGQQSAARQNFQQSNAGGINDFVEFSYKSYDEFLKKAEEFAENLAGDGEDLGKSQLRKFYDDVINLRDEMINKLNNNKEEKKDKEINVDEIINEIIFKLKLLQARVIYLANRKKTNKKTYINSNARKYLLGILERGITLCRQNEGDIKKIISALKKFSNEFEAIYAYFYQFSKDKD